MDKYCVVLRPRLSMFPVHRRIKRSYLRAKTAVQAMLIVSEDPEWLVIGVEPACMFPKSPQSEHPVPAENIHVA